MILWAASVGALALALVAAVLLAHRHRLHLPVVVALGVGLVIDLVVGTYDKATGAGWGLALYLAHRKPWMGLDLALYHVSNALETAWPATLAALAWGVFLPSARRRALSVVLVVWALANAFLVAGYPLGGPRTQRVLLVVELAALGAGAAAAIVGWSGPRWRAPQTIALGLLGTELVVVLAGPFRYSVFERWDLAQVCYMLAFVALAVVQVIAWRRLRPPQAGPSS